MFKIRPVFGALVSRRVTSDRSGKHAGSFAPVPRLCSACAVTSLGTVSCGVLSGVFSELVYRMSEGSRQQQTDQDRKRSERSDEEDEELQTSKRRRAAAGAEEPDGDNRKCPKKKVALLMAYSGKGYYGMQVHTRAAPWAPGFRCSRL